MNLNAVRDTKTSKSKTTFSKIVAAAGALGNLGQARSSSPLNMKKPKGSVLGVSGSKVLASGKDKKGKDASAKGEYPSENENVQVVYWEERPMVDYSEYEVTPDKIYKEGEEESIGDGESSRKIVKLESFVVRDKWGTNERRQKESKTQKLVEMVCKDLQPLTIVEDEGFKDFVHTLQSSFNIPSRNFLRYSAIPELYDKQKLLIKQKLDKCVAVALTLDHWTSASQDAYMALTSHFLSADFCVNDYCLNVKYMPSAHDAKNIHEELCKCLKDWMPQYEEKTVKIYTVTDNAANIKAAMRLLPEGKFKSLFCFAHTLQLVLNDAVDSFPGFGKVISKAKTIVNHFHKSPKDTPKLSDIQKTLGVKQHKLKNHSPTRWNSLYFLMERLVEQREAVTVVLASNEKINNLLLHEWKTAESYVKVLKPFEDITSMMSASRYPTLSMVIPVLNVLRQQMQESEMNDFAEKILNNINKRWPDYENNNDFAIPTIIDPRFKEFAFRDEKAKDYATETVVSLMCDLRRDTAIAATSSSSSTSEKEQSAEEEVDQQPSTSGTVQPSPVNPPSQKSDKGKKPNVWTIFRKMVEKKKEETSKGSSFEILKETMRKEFSIFCADELIEPEKSPFEWWKNNAPKYPNVSKLAQIYLCIPATSVPSEQLFSKAGLVVTQRRNSLDPMFAEQLIFLGHNLKRNN